MTEMRINNPYKASHEDLVNECIRQREIITKWETCWHTIVEANAKAWHDRVCELEARLAIYENILNEDSAAVEELTEAIRYTVDYIGLNELPAIEGWSWYDALKKYAPEKAARFDSVQSLNGINTTEFN